MPWNVREIPWDNLNRWVIVWDGRSSDILGSWSSSDLLAWLIGNPTKQIVGEEEMFVDWERVKAKMRIEQPPPEGLYWFSTIQNCTDYPGEL